jgi:multicomponent Na+:H+ antiporter subunit E
MRMVGWNLALALAWCALAGRLTLVDLFIGYVIGYGLLGWLVPSKSARAYVRRIPRVLGFVGAYAFEVVVSSLRIAWEVVTPWPRRSPGIVEVPLDVETDAEIALLANLVTFTPGTVALDVAEDRSHMLVHDMFIKDPETSRDKIKQRYERWVMRLLR